MSDRMPEKCRIKCQKECQRKCKRKCQIEFQIDCHMKCRNICHIEWQHICHFFLVTSIASKRGSLEEQFWNSFGCLSSSLCHLLIHVAWGRAAHQTPLSFVIFQTCVPGYCTVCQAYFAHVIDHALQEKSRLSGMDVNIYIRRYECRTTGSTDALLCVSTYATEKRSYSQSTRHARRDMSVSSYARHLSVNIV